MYFMKNNRIWLLAFLLVAFACGKKEKTNRQVFEESLEINIQSCVDGLAQSVPEGVELDEEAARDVCLCMLTAAYEVDSTLFVQDTYRAQEILEQHFDEIKDKCRSAIELLYRDVEHVCGADCNHE